MKKYNSSAISPTPINVSATACRRTMVDVLKAAGDNLTRENIMKQAASIHDLKLPMLLPGVTLSTSADDFAPIKQMQLQKFDGDDLEAVRRGHLRLRQLKPFRPATNRL